MVPDAFDGFGRPAGSLLEVDRRAVRVLVVDDDEAVLNTFASALRHSGLSVSMAGCGERALELAHACQFDCAVIDLRLGDMSGLDVVQALMKDPAPPSIILISAWLSIESAVQATRLGAVEVFEKPLDADQLVASILAAAVNRRESPLTLRRLGTEAHYGSVAERWALFVLRGCDAENDPNTLDLLARENAVCYSTFCEVCRLNKIRPLGARDFVRVLRALRKASVARCTPEEFLVVSDRRTLRSLSSRSGIDLEASVTPGTMALFLSRQRFIPAGKEALRLINAVVRGW